MLKVPGKEGKLPLQKKATGLSMQVPAEDEAQLPQLLPYISKENLSEVIYADLMPKFLAFDNNLSNAPGLWRVQIKYL